MTFVLFMLTQMDAVDDMGIIAYNWKGNKETEDIFKEVSWDLPTDQKLHITNSYHDF